MLFAVHISDGLLTLPWLLGGFAFAALLALLGAWRVTEEEIPRVALMTAAFFVASSLRLPLGVSTAHLLLNGLLGVVLGRRAALAIPVGLFMQAALLNHGGLATLGVNSCIQVLPTLLAWQAFALLRRVPWVCLPWFRTGLVAVSVMVWGLSFVFCAVLLWEKVGDRSADLNTAVAGQIAFGPVSLASVIALSLIVAWLERRLETAPEFPLGLLIGELSVLLTVLLQCIVLIAGGDQDWRVWALVDFMAHLPIAVVEGVVLGFTVGFLVRVKPEMLAWKAI
ncbi:MAG: energy-coupling factor ABC transporter permease [Gemmataceae bacterium]|nr:energy-coupling factor ABC transporter permease [Gemmataceae bacterium]